MKTKERLLFMFLGGLLIVVGMVLGQFVFGPAEAQTGSKNAFFETLTCNRLIVKRSRYSKPVAVIGTEERNGSMALYNAIGQRRVLISGANKHGELFLFQGPDENQQKKTVQLTATKRESVGGRIKIYNSLGQEVVRIESDQNDGAVVLKDRYGEPGTTMTGRRQY